MKIFMEILIKGINLFSFIRIGHKMSIQDAFCPSIPYPSLLQTMELNEKNKEISKIVVLEDKKENTSEKILKNDIIEEKVFYK